MDIDSLRIKKFCDMTGWTEKAVNHMISDGVWLDGKEYTRLKNKRLLISIKGYEDWVSNQKQKIPPAFKNR